MLSMGFSDPFYLSVKFYTKYTFKDENKLFYSYSADDQV